VKTANVTYVESISDSIEVGVLVGQGGRMLPNPQELGEDENILLREAQLWSELRCCCNKKNGVKKH
jgi:hypothetical protein